MKNFWQSQNKPILALAPMVDITDSAFRQIAKHWGADVVYSEMISADAIVHENAKTLAMLDHTPTELPLVVQLMGRDPKVLARAAQIAEARGASGIDLNFGCPAQKIAKNLCGVMLMRDLELSHQLIAATIDAVTVPVSIKTRIGIKADETTQKKYDKKIITILDFLEKMKDLPIAAIMVHGRSFEDPFEGAANIEMIHEVKKMFTTGPVLANGGLTTVESSREVLDATLADGLGLARSAIGKPWVFKQIRDFLTTGTYSEPAWDEIKNRMIEHAMLFDSTRNRVPFAQLRRHLSHYVKGVTDATQLRSQLVLANSPLDVEKILATT